MTNNRLTLSSWLGFDKLFAGVPSILQAVCLRWFVPAGGNIMLDSGVSCRKRAWMKGGWVP